MSRQVKRRGISHNYQIQISRVCSVCAKYYSSDQTKKNEIGGVRSTYGERRSAHTILVRREIRGQETTLKTQAWMGG
jgi:hypothetical protein